MKQNNLVEITEIDRQFSDLSAAYVTEAVNQCRSAAQMTAITELDAEHALQEKRERIRRLIQSKLEMLDQDDYPECETVRGTTKDALALEFVNIVLMDGSGIRSRLFGYKDNKLIRAMMNAKEGKYRYLEKKNDRQAIEELDKLADRLVAILTQH